MTRCPHGFLPGTCAPCRALPRVDRQPARTTVAPAWTPTPAQAARLAKLRAARGKPRPVDQAEVDRHVAAEMRLVDPAPPVLVALVNAVTGEAPRWVDAKGGPAKPSVLDVLDAVRAGVVVAPRPRRRPRPDPIDAAAQRIARRVAQQVKRRFNERRKA